LERFVRFHTKEFEAIGKFVRFYTKEFGAIGKEVHKQN